MMKSAQKKLTAKEQGTLLATLKKRFEDHMNRHQDLKWPEIERRLKSKPGKLWSLYQMEESQGEPDVVGFDQETDEYIFCDCSKQSPKGRRSLCYDQEAWTSRKKHKPTGSAIAMATEMEVELLTEEQYRELQALENFDTTTSSWIVTPDEIRALGGALFADYRYGHVFVYHNGAESYYAARGFRASLRV